MASIFPSGVDALPTISGNDDSAAIDLAGKINDGHDAVEAVQTWALGGVPTYMVVPVIAPQSAVTWSSQPAAVTELFGAPRSRLRLDLTGRRQARLTVRTVGAGAAAAQLRAQYSTDESVWAYLDGSAGPSAPLGAANTTAAGAWVDLAAAAKADVVLRVVGIDGDGAANPSFGLVTLQVR